jgi:hypothetical protein
MLTAEDLTAWLAAQPLVLTPVPAGSSEESVAFQPGPYINDMPDRLVTVTISGGSGTFGEEQYEDRPTFAVRSRGAQGFQSDAEQIAWGIDRYLLNALAPMYTPAGVLLKAFSRTGGQPAPLPGTPDTALRYTFTCSYIAIVGRPFGG